MPQSALTLSPIEARIAAAQARVKTAPTSAAYNELAVALCRKGRDTEDVAVYEEAEMAVQKSLQLSKTNYEARKLQVTVLLGTHDFSQALKLATELNRQVSRCTVIADFLPEGYFTALKSRTAALYCT